jgi:hypothetical protein
LDPTLEAVGSRSKPREDRGNRHAR